MEKSGPVGHHHRQTTFKVRCPPYAILFNRVPRLEREMRATWIEETEVIGEHWWSLSMAISGSGNDGYGYG